MLDLDQRVADGLRELGRRAPVDADVWPEAGAHVARHRRNRRALTGAVATAVLFGGGLFTVGLTRGGSSKVSVGDSGVTDPTVGGPSGSLAPLSADGPSIGTLTITTGGPTAALTFVPASLSATTGVYEITLVDGNETAATLQFDDASVRFGGLFVNNAGQHASTRAFFGAPGTYTFYDSIPGHRAAGQFGTVVVSGPTLPASAAGS